jgi:hypothetical protein
MFVKDAFEDYEKDLDDDVLENFNNNQEAKLKIKISIIITINKNNMINDFEN